MEKFFLRLLIIAPILSIGQDSSFRNFEGLHELPPPEITTFLELEEVAKTTWYYDELNQTDGKFLLYPFLDIGFNHYLVQTPWLGGKKKSYNYVLVLRNGDEVASVDTLGPFYDSFVTGAKCKVLKNGRSQILTLRLWSEPLPGEEPDEFLSFEGLDWRFERVNGQ